MLSSKVNYRDGGHPAKAHFLNTGTTEVEVSWTRCLGVWVLRKEEM